MQILAELYGSILMKGYHSLLDVLQQMASRFDC
jgi:hypothetical protein